jgi:formate dehydrogenase-N alpha subunit
VTKLSRRDFLRLSAAGGGGTGLGLLAGPSQTHARGIEDFPLHKKVGEITTICPYCGVGCGVLMGVEEGRIVNIEGDPDHPINEGSLCPKGLALRELANNESRLTKVLCRAPGGTDWEEKTWDWAIEQIARRIKQSRDTSWLEKDNDGYVVNRTEGIASVGSIFPNSEAAYLMSKLLRSLGVVYMENGARICVSSAVAANGETLGRGPASNHWIDIANSDCILIVGTNCVGNFPVSVKWITRAQEKGAKLIHVDPRFTRTSVKADIYARLRSGTDVAFLGGMIKYVLDDIGKNPGNYNLEYIREYTNAPFLVDPRFGFQDGLFSGYDAAKRSYDKTTWQYQVDGAGEPRMDKTLQDPNCVFQLLKKHFDRYDPDTVCRITGTPKDDYLEVCRTYAATGAAGKAGTIIFSAGACEHTHGTQNVRSYGILQLLLGNMGLAGGGLNGITGASNGLGCSLQGLPYDWLPGTLRPPKNSEQTMAEYVSGGGHAARITSLLKAWYGDNATPANDCGFGWLPKTSGDYSWVPLFKAIDAGTIKGLICWAMNPAVSAPNSGATREALAKLDWLVVIDLFESETAAVWKRPGVDPAKNNTEVFLLPAASTLEVEGSVTNTSRWMQWRYKGAEPPGQAKDDLWIIDRLMRKVRALYLAEGGPQAEAITKLAWEYDDPPDPHRVAKEINGYNLTTGRLLPNLTKLTADGSTSSGNWIFCGSYNEDGNMAARRNRVDPSGIGLYPEWGWAWPLNRRIWYNRASVDLNGKPWDEKRAVIRWDAGSRKWVGDQPDGDWPPVNVSGKYPFTEKPQGRAHIFGAGRIDGPFPEHYEPWESPVKNAMSTIDCNPVCKLWETGERGSPTRYPIVATFFRIPEQFDTGIQTRNMPWLRELSPEMFVQIGEELAGEKGIKSGAKVIIESARGQISAIAMVTRRLRPLNVGGQRVHHVGMPWAWGYVGLSKGDSANVLTHRVADANTGIPEVRAFLCNIRKA